MSTGMKQYTIGVVGHTGQVGSVVYAYFRTHGYRTIGISRGGSPEDLESGAGCLEDADIIFVCVPTPFDHKKRVPDVSAVVQVVSTLPSSKIVVIKSTVLPGTTNTLQQQRPDLKILFNPEFLSRITARKDFEKPDRQIIGYTDRSKRVARKILGVLPKAEYSVMMTSSEAELVKYAHNIFGALVITYANHLYDVSCALHLDYGKVTEAFTAKEDWKGLRRYTQVYHNGKRGFGGPCFPKDINSFLVFCTSLGVKAEVIQAAVNANKRLLRFQNLTEQTAERY